MLIDKQRFITRPNIQGSHRAFTLLVGLARKTLHCNPVLANLAQLPYSVYDWPLVVTEDCNRLAWQCMYGLAMVTSASV